MTTDLTDPLTDRLNAVDWSLPTQPSSHDKIAKRVRRRRRGRVIGATALVGAVLASGAGITLRVNADAQPPTTRPPAQPVAGPGDMPAVIIHDLRVNGQTAKPPTGRPAISQAEAISRACDHDCHPAGAWLVDFTDHYYGKENPHTYKVTPSIVNRLAWVVVSRATPTVPISTPFVGGRSRPQPVGWYLTSWATVIDARTGKGFFSESVRPYDPWLVEPHVTRADQSILYFGLESELSQDGYDVRGADAPVVFTRAQAAQTSCVGKQCRMLIGALAWVTVRPGAVGVAKGTRPAKRLAWVFVGPTQTAQSGTSGIGHTYPFTERVTMVDARTGSVITSSLKIPDLDAGIPLGCRQGRTC